MRPARLFLSAGALLAALTLGGCANLSALAVAGAADQPKQVSAEGYRTAFDTFRSCMQERGHVVTDPVVSPVDGMQLVYEMHPGAGGEAGYEKDFRDCYGPFGSVEADYFSTNEPTMAEPLLVEVRTCMDAAGFKLSDNATTARSMRAELGGDPDANRTLSECITPAASKLYPQIPFIPLS